LPRYKAAGKTLVNHYGDVHTEASMTNKIGGGGGVIKRKEIGKSREVLQRKFKKDWY